MGFPDSHPPYMWHGYQNHSDQVPPHKRFRNSESIHGQFMPLGMNPPANTIGSKGTTHIFFKTRMCAKFLEGSCKNGPNCTFAHGADDLREPPPNWQDIVRNDGGSRNWNDDQKMIHKMKICRKYYNGEECSYGGSCNFLHERPNHNSIGSSDEWSRSNAINPYQRESATPFQRDGTVISIGTQMANEQSYDRPTIPKVMNPNSNVVVIKPAYWKTKLCSKWEITGRCPFGERCNFAHGHSGIETKVVGEDKKFSVWKSKKKINKIYGDWIDDLTP